jgi:multiple sugar transport system substrate-binding protein
MHRIRNQVMKMKSSVTRRDFLKLAGITAASAALASCGPRLNQPTATTANPVKLVYRDWRTDWFPPMAQQMLEEFHATHPNIRVYYNLDPEQHEFEQKSLADLEAGTAADVFQGCCSYLPIWAQKGFLLDLSSYVQADLDRETIEDWDRVQYSAFFTRDGRQYALPKYHGALALYYNKDLFDQAYLDYPTESWTHDDYLAVMEHLSKSHNKGGQPGVWGSMTNISWERLQVHVNAWGGHFVDPNDRTKSQMAQPLALQALEWLRARMWDDKVMATELDVQNKGTQEAFIAGQLAMVEEGSWALKNILVNANFPIGLATFPVGPARKATLATKDGFGIYAGTKHPDAAWELLKFLISKEYGRAMAKAQFLQPARESLVEEWVQFVRMEFPEKTKDLNISAFADGHRKGYSVTGEEFANQADAERLADTAWQQIFTLGQSPVDILKDISGKIEESQQGFS